MAYIQPGNPQQNAYIVRFNRTVWYDFLNQIIFNILGEMQEYATNWQTVYNDERPNMELDGFTPNQHLEKTKTGVR